MISGDFNTMECDHRQKGEGKGQFCGISYFWIEVFLKEVLGLLPYEGTTFIPNPLSMQVKARLYFNFTAVRKYNRLDSFCGYYS